MTGDIRLRHVYERSIYNVIQTFDRALRPWAFIDADNGRRPTRVLPRRLDIHDPKRFKPQHAALYIYADAQSGAGVQRRVLARRQFSDAQFANEQFAETLESGILDIPGMGKDIVRTAKIVARLYRLQLEELGNY